MFVYKLKMDNMKTITLNVEGMSCNHCVNAIETALKDSKVQQAKASLEDKSVIIEYDENIVSLDKLKEVIREEGYKVV